ncbi:hypothetical protein LOZ58_001649 [Ophidiomyces ophidiicola]|nr:hypothetical protein LOZ58_001649 [Ophidiomyces ophidiicola]
MASIKITDIPRPDLTDIDKTGPSVTNVEHLSSYNWIESPIPTIAVPGCPPLWSPPRTHRKVVKDSGLIYIAQNAVRHPESPLEPLFRSLYIENPSYNINLVDLITDRNNVRKILSFINPNISKNGREPFTIDVEVRNNTAIFCRAETETHTFIGPNDFRGYGHEFEKAFTTTQIPNSTGHHRVISYSFGGLKIIVRYETDAYVAGLSNPQPHNVELDDGDLLNSMKTLSLSRTVSRYACTDSKLVVTEEGKRVPIQSTLEIKTRVFHKHISIQEVLPQLWVSQTPNLVRAYHKSGWFGPPEVEDVTHEITKWEENHASDLQALVILIEEIIKVVRDNGGNAVIKYDGLSNKLDIWRRDKSGMLPDDLYSKFDNKMKPSQTPELDPRKTAIKIGDVLYNIDLSTIPYFSSFVRFQRLAQPQSTDLIHKDVPLFDVALKGIESGYRQCFRSLRDDISQYHILCETYDYLGVNVLAGQSINDIFADLRACKTDYELEYKYYRAVRGDISRARDAAFRLLFLIIRNELSDEKRDSDSIYNAVLFIVSHPGTFKPSTKIAVGAVFKERFIVSAKQQKQLDRWVKGDTIDSDDESTTEDDFYKPYLSDKS